MLPQSLPSTSVSIPGLWGACQNVALGAFCSVHWYGALGYLSLTLPLDGEGSCSLCWVGCGVPRQVGCHLSLSSCLHCVNSRAVQVSGLREAPGKGVLFCRICACPWGSTFGQSLLNRSLLAIMLLVVGLLISLGEVPLDGLSINGSVFSGWWCFSHC